METTPPFPIVSGQRQLSVIMFTDAVGYSTRMHEQEIATLNRLERDTEVMRPIIEAHSGTVLKSTGDGLLIQFISAVQAVACAQEIQRLFAARTDPTYAKSALRYRIGVHLGDVFVGNGDVMGDGVNIAARLVGQAPPGGIVISHMVYDVVKNKLPLHVLRLGPQPLKNIREPIILYRVLLESPSAPTPVVAPPAPASVPVSVAPARRPRKTLVALVLILALVASTRYLLQEHFAHEDELGRSQSAQAALDALLKRAQPAESGPPPESHTPASNHDFAALVTRTPAIQKTGSEAAILRHAAEQSLEPLLRWLAVALPAHTKDRPLAVTGLGDSSFAGAIVFLAADHQLHFMEGGASRRREWSDLKPDVQAAIMVSAMRASTRPIPPEVRRGAAAFAYLHGLPTMITAMPR